MDLEGKLYVVLHAENIHPGKGTPVTQLDMRRLSDGVKSSQRYKTTDVLERAVVEDRETFRALKAAPARVGALHVPVPFSQPLEEHVQQVRGAVPDRDRHPWKIFEFEQLDSSHRGIG